jgi:hypothetical protein
MPDSVCTVQQHLAILSMNTVVTLDWWEADSEDLQLASARAAPEPNHDHILRGTGRGRGVALCDGHRIFAVGARRGCRAWTIPKHLDPCRSPPSPTGHGMTRALSRLVGARSMLPLSVPSVALLPLAHPGLMMPWRCGSTMPHGRSTRFSVVLAIDQATPLPSTRNAVMASWPSGPQKGREVP